MDKTQDNGKKTIIKDLAIAAFFCAVLIVWFLLICTQDCTSYDNAYQYFLNLHSWKDMFDMILADYSPPLYSVALKLFTAVFGTGLIAARVLSLILLCAQFFLAMFPVKRLLGRKCAILTAFLFLASSYNFYYGVAIRPTVLAYFLTTGMFVYAALAYKNKEKSDLIKFSIFSILCMYTHNVSLIAAFCIYAVTLILALIRKNKEVFKKFLISGISVAVLYIPWLIVLISQMGNVSNNFWECTDSWVYSLFLAFAGYVLALDDVMLALPALLFIIALPIANLLLPLSKEHFKKASSLTDLINVKEIKKSWQNIGTVLYLLLILFVAVTGFYLVTAFIAPIFARRYFFIFSGAGMILISGIATLCKNRKVPAIILAVLCAIPFVSNTIAERKIVTSSTRDKMVADINEITGGKPLFLDVYEETLGVTSYYFPESEHFVTDETFTVLPDFDIFGTETHYLHNGDEIWEYTDEVYIFSVKSFEVYGVDPYEFYEYYFATPEDITIEEVSRYMVPYTNEIGYGPFDITIYRVTKNA